MRSDESMDFVSSAMVKIASANSLLNDEWDFDDCEDEQIEWESVSI